jgi:WD40 repeat protein
MLKTNSLTNFQTFNDKMIISTSRDDKKILLWDENTASVVYTYEDSNMKSFISNGKLYSVGGDLFSEYILALQENKSLMSIWKTNASECAIKCSPIDERITSIDMTSNNKLIFIATETGILHIYELFSGNLINSVNVATTSILGLKSPLQDGGMILILCEDYIKILLLENLISKSNSNEISPLVEVPNYDNFNKFLMMQEMNLVIFYSSQKNKIAFYSFPNLKIVKNIYINNSGSHINSNITSINYDYNLLYVTFDSGVIFLFDIKEILSNEEHTLSFNTFENIFPVIQTESRINSVSITSRNILTGLEDGKIFIWNKFNYKKENVFAIHKGGITNVMVINRPISQYGLNFNSHIEETVVKSLKKSSIGYNHSIFVKSSIKKEDYVENLINEIFDEEEKSAEGLINNEKRKGVQIQVGGSKNFVELTNNTFSKTSNNNKDISAGKKDNFQLNLEDNTFLKKKMGELYSIINN